MDTTCPHPSETSPESVSRKQPARKRRSSAGATHPRPRVGAHPRRHRPRHRRRRLLRDARHRHQAVDGDRADPDGRVVPLRLPGRGDVAGGPAAVRRRRAAHGPSSLPAAARHLAAGVEHARVPEPALHAAGRVHIDRPDRAARRHPARGDDAEGGGVARALGPGRRRLRGHAGDPAAGRHGLQLGDVAAAGAGVQQRLVPGAHQPAGADREARDDALLQRLDRHAPGDDPAALRLDHAARMAGVGAAQPDGAHGHGRPLLPDPRLPAGARVDADALPLCADRVRHARRLADLRARARRRVARRHGAHRGVRRRRRLAHGARAARADRAGGVVRAPCPAMEVRAGR